MTFQAFRQSYALFCDQLSIAPLYELSEDQLVEAAILRSGECNLQGCSITSSDVIALAQTLKYEPIIRSIDLRSNALDDMAALALAEAIATTGFPLVVDFRGNNLTDTGAQALLDTARQIKQVQSILLDNNQVSPALLAQMQALMMQRKLGAAAATAPAPASSSAFISPRSARSDRSDHDLDMDLGFDSEIRPQHDSPSQSMMSSAQKPPKSPQQDDDVVSPLAPVAAASSANAGGTSARRSSFSEALRSTGHDTDFGDSFDWDKADTNDLLDSGAPAPATAAAAPPAVPVFAPAAAPTLDFAPLSEEPDGPPPPVAAYRPSNPSHSEQSRSSPAASQQTPAAVPQPESLSSKSPSSNVAATEAPPAVSLPPPAAVPVATASSSAPAAATASSGHLDDLDDFNFDDSHLDPLESSVRSADPTPIKPRAAANAPVAAAAAAVPAEAAAAPPALPRMPSTVNSFPSTPHDNKNSPQQPAAASKHARDHSVDAQDAWGHKSSASHGGGSGSPQRSRVSSPRSVIHPPPSKQQPSSAVAAEEDEDVKSPSASFVAASHARSASGPESPHPVANYQASTQSSQAQQSHMRSASAYYPHQSTSPVASSNAAAPVVAARPTLLPPDPSELSTDPLDSAAYRTTFTREMLAPSPAESLGPSLSIFHSLRALNLPNLGLTSLPLLPRTLESLSVPQNALGSSALGARVAPLKFLRELDARQCGLTETQGIVGAVHPLLRTLLLSGNALKSLTGFAHLRSLTILDVRANGLANLAALRELSMNPSLKVLRLAANPVSAAGPMADPKAMRTKVLSIVPHIAQLDNHVLALGPIPPKASAPGPEVCMLLEADALDTADLVAALVQFHLPGFKRLFAKLAGEKEDAAGSAAASPTLPLQGLFTHLQSLGFIPYFLLESEAKTLLSLLAGSATYAPGSLAPSSYTASSSRIGAHEFVEFVARACIAKSARMTSSPVVPAAAGGAAAQPMPAVLKSYAKALRALGSDGGSLQHVSPFDEPFLRSLFFSAPSADNPHAHHPWLYANYAVKLLGLLGKPKAPAVPSMMNHSFHSSSSNGGHTTNAQLESYMRNTSSASSRQAEQQQQASPPHSRNVSQTAAQNAASAAASSTTARKKRAPSPSPAAPARKQSPVPATAATTKVSDRLYPPASVKFATAAGAGSKKKPPLAPRPALAAAATVAPTVPADSPSPEIDLPLDHDDPSNQSHDDAHYLPPASTAAAANVLSGLAGIENTLSPHQGRLPARGNSSSSSRKPIMSSGMTLQQRAAAAAAAAYEEEMSNGLQGLSIDANEGEEEDPLSLTAGKGATAPPGRRAPPAASSSATSPPSSEREVDESKPASMEDDSWLDEVDVSTARGIKTIIHNLNAKISKLYSWHLAEIDLVSRQQMQLNSLQSELDVAKSSTAAGSLSNTNASPSPNHSKRPSLSMSAGSLSFEALSPSPAMQTAPLNNQTVAAGRTPMHNPNFSPQAQHQQQQQQQQHLSRSMPVQQPPPPPSQPSQASSDDWTALLHALAVLEQTDPNCAEVQMLRQLIAQEQAQPQPQPLSAYAQQPAPVQQQQQSRQAVPQPMQFQAQSNQPFQPHQQVQFQQTTPAQQAPMQQQPYAHPMTSSPSPPPLSMTLPAPPPSASGSGSVSASVLLSSFWVPSVRDWCLELDEELKTATMALANLLEITDVAPIDDEQEQQQGGASPEVAWYRSQVAEFEQILSVSAMLVPFGLPSHVAALLSALPAELLAAIRASAHRLEATKKSLHSFLALVHTQSPNSALVRELRATILASGVTQLPAPTLEQLASSISHRAVQAAAAATMQQQQQHHPPPPAQFAVAPPPHPQSFAGPALIRPVALFTPIHPQAHAPHQSQPMQTQQNQMQSQSQMQIQQQQQSQQQPPLQFYSMTPSPTMGAAPSPRNGTGGPVATPGHMRSHTIHANPRRWQ